MLHNKAYILDYVVTAIVYIKKHLQCILTHNVVNKMWALKIIRTNLKLFISIIDPTGNRICDLYIIAHSVNRWAIQSIASKQG